MLWANTRVCNPNKSMIITDLPDMDDMDKTECTIGRNIAILSMRSYTIDFNPVTVRILKINLFDPVRTNIDLPFSAGPV